MSKAGIVVGEMGVVDCYLMVFFSVAVDFQVAIVYAAMVVSTVGRTSCSTGGLICSSSSGIGLFSGCMITEKSVS